VWQKTRVTSDELRQARSPFVLAVVVRAERPTSAKPGDRAIIHGDGTIEGFVGGICAEHSVRLFAWTAMKSGEAVLLRILPTEEEVAAHQDAQEDGAVTVLNSCLSGGAIEIFLEPTLPTPRVNIVGSKPRIKEKTKDKRTQPKNEVTAQKEK